MMDDREERVDYAGINADEPAATGASLDEVEISFPTLAGRSQVTPLPVPLQNPALLPLSDLDPEVLERLVAEIVSRQDNRGVQFYGRRGQKQYGLDVLEREKTGTRSLYQVKRYQQIDPTGIREAVEEYAGPARGAGFDGSPRRFDPQRFVVVTSASLDADTANVDEVDRLQGVYDGDLEIEVWGAEA